MKKLIYWSPYIPLVGILTVITNINNPSCIDKSDFHLWMSILTQLIDFASIVWIFKLY